VENIKNNTIITVITVCYNSGDLLEGTIINVLEQTYEHIEYIIIDGGSTDKTINILRKYHAKIDKVISEPDLGIYNAMNKGLSYSSGDLIVFINAGDHFSFKYSLELVASIFIKYTAEMYFGNYFYVSNNTISVINVGKIDNKIDLLRQGFGHPATFYTKQAFLKVGRFSEDYRIVSDADWNFKALIDYQLSFYHINLPLSVFYSGGISTNLEIHNKERQEMINRYFSPFSLKILSSNSLRRAIRIPLVGQFLRYIFKLSLNKI
jgi:glycosyltransferase involved in cell wall biosynthesis